VCTGTEDGSSKEKEVIWERLSWAGHVAHVEKKTNFIWKIANFGLLVRRRGKCLGGTGLTRLGLRANDVPLWIRREFTFL